MQQGICCKCEQIGSCTLTAFSVDTTGLVVELLQTLIVLHFCRHNRANSQSAADTDQSAFSVDRADIWTIANTDYTACFCRITKLTLEHFALTWQG